MQVRNNTFAFASGALVLVDRYSEEYSRIFTDNTYVQYSDIPLIHTDSANLDIDIYDPQAALEVLGDESGTVISLDKDIRDNRLG